MQHPRRKILFLPSWFPNRKHPENGDFILRHARAAARIADIYVVFLTSDNSLTQFIHTEKEDDHDVQIHRVFYSASKIPFIQFFQYIYVYMLAVHRLVQRIGMPDLAHVHVIYPAGLPAVFFKWLFGIRFLITEHWTGHLPSNSAHDNRLRRFISKFIAREAEIVAPVSNDLMNALRSKGMGRKFRLLFNVVDTGAFQPVDSNTTQFRLIHVSSLKNEQKNISGMLNVMKRLDEAGLAVMLDIVGDGDPSMHIRQATELNILNRNVRFYPRMEHGDLARFMAEHDAFLLFSNSENLPCVMVEAMACGLPMISSNVGGISEHVDESRGILVEPGDESALYNAIVKASGSCKAFNKEEIRRYAEQYFSVEAVASQFDALYEEILSGGSHAH